MNQTNRYIFVVWCNNKVNAKARKTGGKKENVKSIMAAATASDDNNK